MKKNPYFNNHEAVGNTQQNNNDLIDPAMSSTALSMKKTFEMGGTAQ